MKIESVEPGSPLETSRLRLRRWMDSDRAPFACLNADPRVMEFLPGCLTGEQSDQAADRIGRHFQQHGFGLYAAELIQDSCFAGFIGISVVPFQAEFTPCVEIGWRLAAGLWGQGLATEGARAVMRYAFEQLRIEELVSFTVPLNQRSRRVMEKIGMHYDASGDFDHPKLPAGHPLSRHVLYRLTREQWAARNRLRSADEEGLR